MDLGSHTIEGRTDIANVLQVAELQMHLMRTSTQSNAAMQHFEQTVAQLTLERGAAEQAADQARQAATAADLRVKQLQGELAAAASEREWAQESTGALQVRLGAESVACTAPAPRTLKCSWWYLLWL
jgi:hypothetical protein